MLRRGHHTTIFIISMFMLLLLEDLLAKFIITCTLKNKLTTWMCLVEGNLTSLRDLVRFKIEHMQCSRMRCVTKKMPSTDLVSNLSNFFPFLRMKHLQPKTWK
jgi:hypothetical protein